MGRPREHDEQTRAELLAAAERLLSTGGLDAVSVRAVAEEVGASTRAVYSLFGAKAGLLDALGAQAFRVLSEGLDTWPETADPAADLIGMATRVYRRLFVEHPSMYRLAFQRIPGAPQGEELVRAREGAFAALLAKTERLEQAGVLAADRTPRRAAVEFIALCEGMAGTELRGVTLRLVPAGEEEQAWRGAFETLLRGLTTNGARP